MALDTREGRGWEIIKTEEYVSVCIPYKIT